MEVSHELGQGESVAFLPAAPYRIFRWPCGHGRIIRPSKRLEKVYSRVPEAEQPAKRKIRNLPSPLTLGLKGTYRKRDFSGYHTGYDGRKFDLQFGL